jgi:hypothetical protein
MQAHRHSPARPLLVVLVALAAVTGACTSGPAAQTTTPTKPITTPTVPTMTPAMPAATGAPEPTPISTAIPDPSGPLAPVSPVPGDGTSVPQGILDAVLADAAARTGAAVADITVVEATSVTWPNGALGCPQPGMMYTDMIVPGYHVIVEAGGRQLDYRFGMNGAPLLCENPPPMG